MLFLTALRENLSFPLLASGCWTFLGLQIITLVRWPSSPCVSSHHLLLCTSVSVTKFPPNVQIRSHLRQGSRTSTYLCLGRHNSTHNRGGIFCQVNLAEVNQAESHTEAVTEAAAMTTPRAGSSGRAGPRQGHWSLSSLVQVGSSPGGYS